MSVSYRFHDPLDKYDVCDDAASTVEHDATASTWSGDTAAESRAPSRTAFSLKKRLTSSRAKKQSGKGDGERQEDVRGPLGLRLVHSSPEPLIDLIFVHGLRGGSVKTWRKGNDPSNFWPQLWLPLEPGLRHANIHSFGYQSDWASTKSSILDIHDFGQSLLEEMRNSPHLRHNSNASGPVSMLPSHLLRDELTGSCKQGPIILIGHSMGGLVIKKAFILAKDVPGFQPRIRTIFFLATPHRGSDYAALLNNILTVSGFLSPRQYVNDIMTGSTSAQLINDAFEKQASELPVFSFYETLRMNLGISSSLIVDKSSAVLGHGFKNERVQYLNANHRDVCKFEDHDDPNYVTLKNALINATQSILQEVLDSKSQEYKKHMSLLKSYLGIRDRAEEAYQRAEGSCTWIDEREDFQEWRDSATDTLEDPQEAPTALKNPAIFWVRANPGTGKSFLASYVVHELAQFQADRASFFFHAGSKSSTLGYFLRCIAYQMAGSNASIRERLLRLHNDEMTFDQDDAATIWTKIFKNGIFRSRIRTTHYWVIDAMDECSKFQDFFPMVKSVPADFPLRIFITSRKVPEMQRIIRTLEPCASVTCTEIQERDSIQDIERYVKSRTADRPLLSESSLDEEDLTSLLLRKSNGCFLWVRLVLDELEQVYSHDSMVQALDSIPEGMVPYYERTVQAMAERKEKHIAQALLLWVIGSSRKLHISELAHALELDVKAVLPSAQSAVEGLCGQLVAIDSRTGLVDFVHPTVREFLLSPAAADFAVAKSEAHERIALTCMRLLCSTELAPPRSARQLAIRQAAPKSQPSPLVEYAITEFSEHVYMATSEADQLLVSLDRFFKTNVLSWVERIARKGDLHPLIRVAKNLKSYLDRRAKYSSPLNTEVNNLDLWSTDLGRITTRFGTALLDEPAAIYFLIPPLCPSGSAIHQRFARRPDGLSVIGHTEAAWDDCTASVSFGHDHIAAAVSCGQSLIAVGMESGDVELYDHRSCQKAGALRARSPVDLVHVTESGVAVCTTKAVLLLDLRTGATLWSTRLRFRCILLTSTAHAVVAVSQHGHVLHWDMATGALLQDQACEYRTPDVEGAEATSSMKAPHVASMSADLDMVALGFRAGTVCLFEVSGGELICWARDDQNRLVSVLLFNPNPNIDLLLVIFRDHELALYDTFSGQVVSTQTTATSSGVLSAACSLDGRTLATMDTLGLLQIWDYESLCLLYHVSTSAAFFCVLSFTSDASAVVDLADSGMRMWSPAVLIRKNIEEDQSISEAAANLPAIEGGYETTRATKTTALHAHPSLPFVFCGTQDGRVLAFSTKTGAQVAELYTHSNGARVVHLVSTARHNLLASSDDNGVVQVWKLGTDGPLRPTLDDRALVFTTYATARVKQLCFDARGATLLVSTEPEDRVYATADGSCRGTLPFSPAARRVWRWLADPDGGGETEAATAAGLFYLLADRTLAAYHGATLQPARGEVHRLAYDVGAAGHEERELEPATAICPVTRTLAVAVRHGAGFTSSSTTFLFDLGTMPPCLAPHPAAAANKGPPLLLRPHPPTLDQLTTHRGQLARSCRQVLSLGGGGDTAKTARLTFLHRTSWVCSLDLGGPAGAQLTRHFFLPNEYVATASEVPPVRTADGGLVCILHGELAIVRNGLGLGGGKAFG